MIRNSIPILVALAAPAAAQCSATLTATTHTISVSRGGAQNLVLQVTDPDTSTDNGHFHVVGSFNAPGVPNPHLLHAGINLTTDRYLYGSVLGRSPLLSTRVTPGNEGYHWIYLDENLTGMTQAFVEPAVAARYVGRTVYHAAYRQNSESFLPECGTNLVALTFVP